MKLAWGGLWTLSVNQLFFHTRLTDALVFRQNNTTQFFYENADGPVTSSGLETNMKLGYRDFKLIANYALIDTQLKYDNLNEQKPLTPKRNVGAVLMYEVEGKWRIGYELNYTGHQFRPDPSRTDNYLIMGLMMLRKWKHLSVYLNFENFTDTRQHRLESFDVGEQASPNFPVIWAPVDGRIVNGGFIYEL